MFKKIVWLWFSTKWKKAQDVEKYIQNLVDGWATEFFTGYNPPYWHELFGFEVSPNGRFAEHEQITDYESLKLIVEEVHKHWFELFINLNAWYYTDVTFPLVEKMVWEFIELGIDWIICWNIGILEYLKSINYSGKINISTIMAVYNTEAIRFFIENYKINKVILSREITLKEIENIVTTFPNTKFEVFWEGDFCRYNNGLCFAEHKYWVKDICTVVVNDLIIKKRFRADFKEILLKKDISNIEKIKLFDDKYLNDFEQIQEILGKIELGFLENEELILDLEKIILKNLSRIDLFFDWLKPLTDAHNLRVLTFLKALKYYLSQKENSKFREVFEELNISFKNYIKYNKTQIESIWSPQLKAMETKIFYSKGDNLNLYSYLFFSKFPNIETVKFPTRWRNYNEKLKLIEEVVNLGVVDEKYFDAWMSLERAHYDLTYIFGDKLWFRKIIKNL